MSSYHTAVQNRGWVRVQSKHSFTQYDPLLSKLDGQFGNQLISR